MTHFPALAAWCGCMAAGILYIPVIRVVRVNEHAKQALQVKKIIALNFFFLLNQDIIILLVN